MGHPRHYKVPPLPTSVCIKQVFKIKYFKSMLLTCFPSQDQGQCYDLPGFIRGYKTNSLFSKGQTPKQSNFENPGQTIEKQKKRSMPKSVKTHC